MRDVVGVTVCVGDVGAVLVYVRDLLVHVREVGNVAVYVRDVGVFVWVRVQVQVRVRVSVGSDTGHHAAICSFRVAVAKQSTAIISNTDGPDLT